MDTTSMIQRTNKVARTKMKACQQNLRNHWQRPKRNITKSPQNGDPHNYHHTLASHFRNRHISPRSNLRQGKNHVNGFNKYRFKYKKGHYHEELGGTSVEENRSDDYNGNEKGDELLNSKDELIVGNFTREVYNAICLRLGDTLHIPEDSVKALFNDMHLFPSDTQVTKMLQCARQYSKKNGSNPNGLTFSEMCVFVREMQNYQSSKAHRKLAQQKVNKCPNGRCEVFLGGSCNPTTWRADTAIPELQKHGISFYNPQVSIWAPELLAQEHDAKQSASVLLFVIDSQTRSTVGMLEVAYLVACGRCVIVVAQPYRIGQTIMGEVITDKEYYDLVQGQKSLLDLIKSKGVQIHTNLSTALQCTADILKNVAVNGTSPEEQITYKLRRLREVYDSYNGHMHMFDVIDAYRRLTNQSLEISKLYNYFNLQNGSSTHNGVGNSTSEETTLSFEKFCTIMAELSTNGCGMCNIEAWASQTFTRNQHTQCGPTQNHSTCANNPSQEPSSLAFVQEHRYDVYLGGSLSTGTKWRESIAIPLLKANNLQYYNPAIRESEHPTSNSYNEQESGVLQTNVSEWKDEISACEVALFVITNDTRSLTSMILAAHYIGIGKNVILSMEQLNSEHCVVANETLTKIAIKDYNRARTYLRDLAERRDVPVFDNVEEAVTCVVLKLSSKSTAKENSSVQSESTR
uniref:Nucleoside 2-deoxyribosyltransferase like protein n=1 Tax=Dendroctonus ponderosae TaxID=77166 RepID=A0AAR5Q3L5_DENPD